MMATPLPSVSSASLSLTLLLFGGLLLFLFRLYFRFIFRNLFHHDCFFFLFFWDWNRFRFFNNQRSISPTTSTEVFIKIVGNFGFFRWLSRLLDNWKCSLRFCGRLFSWRFRLLSLSSASGRPSRRSFFILSRFPSTPLLAPAASVTLFTSLHFN